MVQIEKYNPCSEYINFLKNILLSNQKSSKSIVIKYDRAAFITNLTCKDIVDFEITGTRISYNNKGLLVIKPDRDFFVNWIDKCTAFDFVEIDDIQLCSIIKRMYAQIEFGYYSDCEITKNEISICDNIFKAIYTSSESIKRDNINKCVKKYDELQKQGYANKKIIDGIIYAAYDLYNSLNK